MPLKSELTKHNLCIEPTGNFSTFSKFVNLSSRYRSYNTNIATQKKKIYIYILEVGID